MTDYKGNFLKIIWRLILICFILSIFDLFILNYIFRVKHLVKSLESIDKLDEYVRIHEINSDKSNKNRKQVYFVYKDSGYGNNMYGVLSSLVIAILTDRAFFVDWNYVGLYINSPLKSMFTKFENKSAPGQIETDLNLNVRTINTWKHLKNLDILLNTSVPNTSLPNIINNCGYAHFFEICSNTFYHPKLLHYKLVSNKTIYDVNQVLAKNSGEIDDLEKMQKVLMVGFEVGSRLLRKFWIPNRNITDIIDQFYEQQYRDNFVIGMQFRAQFLNNTADAEIYKMCYAYRESIRKAKEQNSKMVYFL